MTDANRYKARIAELEAENKRLKEITNKIDRSWRPGIPVTAGTIEINNCKSIRCTSGEFPREPADGKS